jgi:signal transduction histidine kinase
MDRQKLLIVDDSPQSIKILRHALKDSYDLLSAGDGINALEIAGLEHPDLILLDVMMPGMDGFEVCRILKEHEELKEIPVLFLTSLTEAVDEVKGLKLGAVDFITKPFRFPVVKQRIEIHLLKRQKELLGQKNDFLQKEIDEKISELRQKDKTMILQSRQAAMGEMIGNIAHQWRQPLNALAGLLVNIQQAYQYNELTVDYLDDCVKDGGRLIQKMSATINDFRNFFLPDKEAVLFSAQNQINHALSLVEAGLQNQNITIHLEAHQDVLLTGFPNEYSQVILDLLSNAGEAVKAKCVLEGLITIRLFKRDGWGCVSIRDNGGGIAADVIDKIFEPYFSTKKMGTGIGLYMSKMIIERSMNGTIEAHNSDDGAEFIVSIPQGAAL